MSYGCGRLSFIFPAEHTVPVEHNLSLLRTYFFTTIFNAETNDYLTNVFFFSDSSNSCWLPVKAASNQASSLHTSGTFLTAKFNSLPHSMCLNRETRSTNSLSVISTLTPSRPPVKASLRSLSVDASYSERIDCDEDGRAKQTLSLRRYSFQGLEQSQKICRNTTSSSFSRSISNAPFKDKVDKPTSYFWKSPSTTTSSTSMHTSGGTMTADSTAFSNKLLSPSGFLPQSNALATTMLTTDDLRGRTVSYEASNGSMLKKTLFPQCNCLSGNMIIIKSLAKLFCLICFLRWKIT